MDSKIIQISGDGQGYIYALCEDGSLWYFGHDEDTRRNDWFCACTASGICESGDMFPEPPETSEDVARG